MSEMATVALLLSEQGAALFPVRISVRNNTPMTLSRTGARIGVAPYGSAEVEFLAQADLARFAKKVSAQARLTGDDPEVVYPMTVLSTQAGQSEGVQPVQAAVGAQPAHDATEATQTASEVGATHAPAPKRTSIKKGAGA